MDNSIEKSVVKWLDQIVGRPAEQLGLLLEDSVRKWRLNNQLRILQSAQKKCEKYNRNIKIISPKLLCPLLDLSSLEEEPIMQDKWANLLANMLDADQNIQNHVFPFILSQISKEEFIAINDFYISICEALSAKSMEIDNIYLQLEEIPKERERRLEEITTIHGKHSGEWYQVNHEYNELEVSTQIEYKNLMNEGKKLATIPGDLLEVFEFENLIRLGLVKILPVSEATAFSLGRKSRHIYVDVEHIGFEYEITNLGEQFIFACNEIEKEKPQENEKAQ